MKTLAVIAALLVSSSRLVAQDGRNGFSASAVWTMFRQNATDVSVKMKGVDIHYSRRGGGQSWGEIGATIWEPGRYLVYFGGGRYFGALERSVYAFARAGIENGTLPDGLIADEYRPDMGLAGVVLGGAGVQFHIAGPLSLDVGGIVGIDVWQQEGQVGGRSAHLFRTGVHAGLKLNFGPS